MRPPDRPSGPPPRRDEGGDAEGGRRRHFGRRRVCAFCADKVTSIDYKDAMRLRRFLSDRARIEPRRKTGTCAKHQRWLASALKRARHLAMLPYSPEHIRTSGVSTGRGR
jgi:small subunit ribosomal protein S18